VKVHQICVICYVLCLYDVEWEYFEKERERKKERSVSGLTLWRVMFWYFVLFCFVLLMRRFQSKRTPHYFSTVMFTFETTDSTAESGFNYKRISLHTLISF
jgi:hypothetical protein